jgi:pimeloyl-ACP methyl ester carboxylesterase
VRERFFEVFGRRLAALEWGEQSGCPVLALHGWLDNAASFLPLAKALVERGASMHLVALDLAGHGQSDHRAADGEYNAWSDLPDIEAVVDQLGWERFALLGHSRGAMICTLYSSARPERIDRVAWLDGIVPPLAEPDECPRQLAEFLADKRTLLDKPGRTFTRIEDAVRVRERKGLAPAAARLIAQRNLRPVESGWCWSHDARLQGASAMRLTHDHMNAVLAGISMPGLLLLAESGMSARYEIPALPGNIRVATKPGGHHCHMDEAVDAIATELESFFSLAPEEPGA